MGKKKQQASQDLPELRVKRVNARGKADFEKMADKPGDMIFYNDRPQLDINEFSFFAFWRVGKLEYMIDLHPKIAMFRFVEADAENSYRAGFFAADLGKLTCDYVIGNLARMLQLINFGVCAKVSENCAYEGVFVDSGPFYCSVPASDERFAPVNGTLTVIVHSSGDKYVMTVKDGQAEGRVSYPQDMFRWLKTRGIVCTPDCLWQQNTMMMEVERHGFEGYSRRNFEGYACMLVKDGVQSPSTLAIVTPPNFDFISYEAKNVVDVLKVVMRLEERCYLGMAHHEWDDEAWARWNIRYAELTRAVFKLGVKVVRVHSEDIGVAAKADLVFSLKGLFEDLLPTLDTLRLEELKVCVNGWISVKTGVQLFRTEDFWPTLTRMVECIKADKILDWFANGSAVIHRSDRRL